MKNAIIYTRVSTDDQADRGFSLPHQKEVLLRYCSMKDIQVLQHYQEDHSAKTFDRPEFLKLYNFVRANKREIDLLLFTRWDRFSRNTEEAYRVIREMREMGIEVNSVEQPLDMSQPDSKIMLAIYLTVPEVENDKISIRTKEGSRKARKEGCWTGTPPFGYKNVRNSEEKSTLEPNEKAMLVKEAFEVYAKGIYAMDEVRKQLRPKGLTVSKNQFTSLLRNPVYTGKVFVAAWGAEKEQLVEGLHPGIISEELFETVQDIITGKTRKTRLPAKREVNLPLRGYLICPRCNNTLTGSGSVSRNKSKHYYYHCQKGCKERVRADFMNDRFVEFMNGLTVRKEVAELYHHVLLDVYKGNEGERRKQAGDIDAEIQKLKETISQAEDRLFEGKIDLDTFNRGKQKYAKAIQNLQCEKEELKNLDTDLMNQISFSLHLLQNLGQLYENSSFEVRRVLIGSIFPEKIVFVNNEYRTTYLNEVLALLLSNDEGFRGNKKRATLNLSKLPSMAPPSGLEPETP